MNRQSHMTRNVVLVAGALIALVVAAALLEGGALATMVALFALGIVVLVLPLVVIRFDEHDERLDHRGLRGRR